MRRPNRPARLNRTLLSLLGLLLLLAGAFTITTNRGVLPLLSAQSALIPPGVQLLSWVPYLATALAILLALACLGWLATQTRHHPRTTTLRLETGPEFGTTSLRGDTATAPLITDIETYPAVAAATAWLDSNHHGPTLALTIRVEPTADLTDLRDTISTHALPRLCQALQLHHLPTTVQFEPSTATTSRAN